VKMMLNALSLFLVGSIIICFSFFLTGCQPEKDLYIYISNETNVSLLNCNYNLSFCDEIKSRESYMEDYATKNQAEEFFSGWLKKTKIKACNKIIPLENLILPVMKRKEGDKMIYQLVIPQEYYDRECKKEE